MSCLCGVCSSCVDKCDAVRFWQEAACSVSVLQLLARGLSRADCYPCIRESQKNPGISPEINLAGVCRVLNQKLLRRRTSRRFDPVLTVKYVVCPRTSLPGCTSMLCMEKPDFHQTISSSIMQGHWTACLPLPVLFF